MAGFSDFQQSGVAGTSSVDDNTASSVLIESADGEDYLQIDTTDDASKVIILGTHTEADNQSSGMVGIRESTPKAPLHIVGTGGSTGMSIDPTSANSPTVFIENSNNNSKDRCVVAINGDGNSGASVDLYQADTRRLGIGGFSSGAILFTETVPLEVSASSGQHIKFTTAGGSERLRILNDGEITTGGETTPQCAPAGGLHIQTGTGSTLSAVHTLADELVVEGATDAGATFLTGGTGSSTYIMFARDDNNQAGALFYGHASDRFEIRAGEVWISTFTSTGQVNGAELQADYLFQAQDGEIGIVANSADANGQSLVFTKSRNATDRQHAVVNDDDVLGEIEFKGSDGNTFALGAKIFARVNGTPGDGDMPSELVLSTSADGSEAPTERMTILSDGNVHIGSPSVSRTLSVAGEFRVDADPGAANLDMFQVTNMSGAGSNGILGISQGDISFRLKSSGARFGIANDSDTHLAVFQDGTIATGGETTSLAAANGLHLKIADSGLANPNANFDDLVIEGSGATGMTFSAPANSGIRFQKDANNDHHGITFDSGTTSIRTRLGSTDRFYIDDAGRVKLLYSSLQFFSGLGDDDDTSEPLYLADSGATLVIDVRKGNYGDVTLTADVTAIKFFHAPSDGNVYTMTAKIKQHASSAKTIDYSDSAVTVFSDAGSTSVTGEMKFSGGVHHTMSTTTGAIDIVQFTIFPNGSTFDVYASVIGQNFS